MMTALPETITQAFSDREGPVIFTTVDSEGLPNAIYATCVNTCGDSSVVVADNYFDKTRKNIRGSSKGSILFITKAGTAYQLKGPITYHTEGPVFDAMKTWNPPKHPGHAAAELTVTEAYSGAKRLL